MTVSMWWNVANFFQRLHWWAYDKWWEKNLIESAKCRRNNNAND